MAKELRYTFLIHAVVALVFGAPLLIMPGRFLAWFGWAPVDPILSRVLGAALLALAWSSYRGWRAKERAQVSILLEMEAAYTVLGAIGVLRHLLVANYPWPVWLLFAVLAIFALVWLYFLFRK
jgi:Co/Zn/Cd efflux system component